jgi:hypothetical protein
MPKQRDPDIPERRDKPMDLTDLMIGGFLVVLVAAAIWLILIPGMTKADETIKLALPTCAEVAKQRPEPDRRRFVQECESRRSAAYMTAFMSMM